jgi:hypothetical protein
VPLIEYLAGVATVVLLNRLYEEIYWRREESRIVHWPPYDRQNLITNRFQDYEAYKGDVELRR